MRKIFLLISHVAALGIGFAAGIYVLPILTQSPPPSDQSVQSAIAGAVLQAEFRRDLAGSDFLHWGEGKAYITDDRILFRGALAPGPDYALYLSPSFVENEAEFAREQGEMVRIGSVERFADFILPLPEGLALDRYTTVVIWCEAFEEFITAARFRD